jgi:predicted extracellular nuclease
MRPVTCRAALRFALLLVITTCSGAAYAQIVINEIMQNPSAVSDANGEWFELFNSTGADVDIDGWTIEDNDVDAHVIDNGGPLVVPAGGYIVLGVNADSSANGGVTVAYQYPSDFFLSNSSDELVLRDGGLTEIDRVEWDDGATFPDPNGASMSLIDPALDNNVGGNWCTASTPFGDGDLGTPGAANDCPAPPPPLVINELHADPDASIAGDANGDGTRDGSEDEFIELVNVSGADLDISGWTLSDAVDVRHTFPGGTVVSNNCSVVVFGGGTPTGTFGDAVVQVASTGFVGLNNSGDTVTVSNGGGDVVSYTYGSEGGNNQSLTRDPDITGPDPLVQHTTAAGSGGALFSPGTQVDGTAFAGCVTSGGSDSLVINEIDYDQPSTDTAEFIEILNVSGGPVDLDNWSLELINGSNGTLYNTIDLPAVSLAAGDYFVVCGDAANVFACDLDVTPDSNLIQNGAPDAVALLLDGAIVDTVSYEGSVPGYTEDSGDGLVDSSSAVFRGISRFPNGTDTDRNNQDFSPRCVTPGSANAAASGDCPDPRPPRLLVNEIDYDQPGSDTAEFVEIVNAGNSGVDLTGVELVLVNGNNSAVYNTIALPSVVLGAGELFVVCGNAANVANCDLDVTPDSNLVQNGAPDAVALVRAGVILDTVSYEGDTAAPWTEGSGSGLVDSGSSGQDYKGISRFPNGNDTDQNNVDLVFACITPGLPNNALAENCSPVGPVLEIFDIQGSGDASPYEGQGVASQDNIVTALGTDGFFIQTPDARDDLDVDTSNGIFVFTGAAPAVAVGDQVDVSGTVQEFFGFTEFGPGTAVSVDSSGNGLPAITVFDASVPSPDPAAPSCAIEFECYEGMRVEITGGTVTGPNQRFNPDPVAEVHITAAPERTFREPGIEYPGLPGYPVWDGNPEVFELDPDKLGLPNEIIPAGSSFSATGVIGFEFGGYELWPDWLDFTPSVIPVPVPARGPAEMTVGSLNLFRLFDDVDDGGEQVVDSAEYARRLGKFSDFIRNVMDAPDVLAVQEVEKLGVLEDLAAEIAADDPAVAYSAFLVEGNDVGGIDVGFLTRDSITVDQVTQLGAAELLSYDGSLLHDRPPLLLEGRNTADGSDFPFAVMVVHSRSLGGIDDPFDGERVRQKRLEQAESIATKTQALQDADPDINLVVIGDFNAFEFSDSYVDVTGHMKGDFIPEENLVCETNDCDDLVDPDLVDQALLIPEEERYSFIFRGSAQVLDHALTSSALDELIRNFAMARGNADAAFDLINDGATPLRSSDHDGIVLFLAKDSDGDGVTDDADRCPGTVIPEGVPTIELGINRFALTDGDRIFDTVEPEGEGPGAAFDIFDTAGCSCEQIIAAQGLGKGHEKYGCSLGEMEEWVEYVNLP